MSNEDELNKFSTSEDTSNDVRPRNFFWTLNNYTPEEEAFLKTVVCKYMCFGYEVGKECGTPHLQGMTCFKDPLSWSAVKKRLGTQRISVRKAYEVIGARKYCIKDGKYYESGNLPKSKKEQGDAGKEFWTDQLKLAEEGRFTECHPRLQLLHREALVSANHRFRDQFKFDYIPYNHIWIWGKSRIGKTRCVWEQYPLAFFKTINKWWCNYDYEDVIVIEDIDFQHDKMLYFIKLWTDGKEYKGESKKMGARRMRPKLVVVTSNYHPSEIWLRERDADPVIQRFDIYNFKQGEPNTVNWPLPRQVDDRITYETFLARKATAILEQADEPPSEPQLPKTKIDAPESKRHHGLDVLFAACEEENEELTPFTPGSGLEYLSDDIDERSSNDGSKFKD